MAGRGEFLEWAEFNGQLYGTAKAFVEKHLEQGEDVILDIDVQGAKQVKSKVRDARAIFVLPPSFKELERRLKSRMLESDDVIRRRLEIAKGEIQFYTEYDYIIINDVLENPSYSRVHRAAAPQVLRTSRAASRKSSLPLEVQLDHDPRQYR
jgi:guanylate kinase